MHDDAATDRAAAARHRRRAVRKRSRWRMLKTPIGISVVIFALASLLYAVFVYPWAEMNTYTGQQLQTIGTHLDRAYLPYDSGGYLDSANRTLGAVLHDAIQVNGLHFGLFSNVSLEVLGYVALTIAPRYPYFVIAIVNYLLFVWAAFHYRAIARRYRVDFQWFLPLLILNPLVLFSLYTLNKEALGLFLVAGLFRYSVERSWKRFTLLLVLSLYTRNIFFFFGLILLLRPFLYEIRFRSRRRPVWAGALLLAMSLVVPFGLYVTHGQVFGSEFGGSLDVLAKYFHQQTGRILSFVAQADKLPFGYLLGYPIVTVIDIASPALNIRYWIGYRNGIDVAVLLLQLSSVAFVALLVLAYRSRPRLGLFAIEPLRLVFAITLFSSVYPLSQHRYLLPFYPLIVLTYVIASKRGTDVQDRADVHHHVDLEPRTTLSM